MDDDNAFDNDGHWGSFSNTPLDIDLVHEIHL